MQALSFVEPDNIHRKVASRWSVHSMRILFWVTFGAICGAIAADKSSYGEFGVYFLGAFKGAALGLICGASFEKIMKGRKSDGGN